METRKPVALRALRLAYATPQVLPPRRSKPSGVPGWLFDVVVVTLLLVFAVAYCTT